MNREQRRAAKAKGEMPKIVNFPDDSAPDEGAYIFVFNITMIEGPLVVDYMPQLMEFTSKVVKGGRKSPVCFCCEKQFDPNSRPAVALYNRQLIPNPKADPRRFRQAKAYVPEPYDAIIAVCNDCVPWGGKDPLPILKARLVKDYDKPGYSMDPTLAARVMHPAGRA